MKVTPTSTIIFSPSPRVKVASMAWAFYLHPTEPILQSQSSEQSASDISDCVWLRRSEDNGQSWSDPEQVNTRYRDGDYFIHKHLRGAYADPGSGRAIKFHVEGKLRTEDPAKKGQKQWALYYSVSSDIGKSWTEPQQIIHQDEGFDETNPFPGVTIGVNGMQLGDAGQRPITLHDGTILLPIQLGRQGNDGQYFNPNNALTFTDCMVLHGNWASSSELQWTCSNVIFGDPEVTTRGLIEPTIARIANNRIIMVMRGSNQRRPDLPGYRWISHSTDQGRTWSPAEAWTYEDGQTFFSPSSCSQLIEWSDGRVFWIGNLLSENPNGNWPRKPLVIGEVCRDTGCLLRRSVQTLVDVAPTDSPHATLSNFFAYEDYVTGELAIFLPKLFPNPQERKGDDWTSHTYCHRFLIK